MITIEGYMCEFKYITDVDSHKIERLIIVDIRSISSIIIDTELCIGVYFKNDPACSFIINYSLNPNFDISPYKEYLKNQGIWFKCEENEK
jgi:hypothetical protein